MGFTITHPKVLPGPDDDDVNTVSPTDWNIAHTITGSVAASEVTSSAALTKVDDTNVTLTLGGSPTTALLAATSITVGWTSTLALSRFAQGTDGQLLVGQTSAASQYKTITGDISITAAGAAAVNALHSGALANPSVSIGLTATNGTALTALRSDGAPALSQAIVPTWTGGHTFSPASGDAITVNPAALSTAKAFVATQSTPTSGTTAGPFASNVLNLTYSIRTTGSGSDATGNNNAGAVGFRVNQTITTAGVASTSAPIITGLFSATVNTTTAITDVTGLAGTAFTNVAMSGAYLEGLNGVATVGATGSANILVGLDVGAQILTGGTATYRFGISVLSGGNVNGTTNDAAIAFNSNTTTKFTNVFLFSNFSGTAPIGASTSVFKADTAYSIAGFANLPTMSVSGYVLQFDKLGLSGDGRMIIGGNSNTVLALPIVFTAQVASGGRVALNSAPNSTTGFSGLDVLSSTNAVEAFVQCNEPGRTAVRFGQTSGSWAEIGSITGNGLLFGTEDSTPLIIGTNNTNRMQVTAAGLVNIGTYVAPAGTDALTINKNAASPVAGSLNALLHLVGADAVQNALLFDSFQTAGANKQPFIVTRAARGTGASFTATQTADLLGFFGMIGASGANTFIAENGAAGGVFFGGVATENWSGTNQGSKLKLYTTANGTAAIAETLSLQAPGATLMIGTAIPAGGTAGTGYMFSSTANFGTFFGSGAPSLSAAKGSLYLRSDGSATNNRAYINTDGSTTWTAITTAA